MKLATLKTDRGLRACAFVSNGYVDLNACDPSLPASLRELIAGGPALRSKIDRAVASAKTTIDPNGAKLAPTIPDPPKIVCLGLNYRDHALESNAPIPEEPILFSKYPTALIGPGDAIELPPVSQEVDYEAELVVAIGRGGKNVARDRAMDHVAGYMIGHDVSARDWQLRKPGKQWMAGKTFDTFAPVGPWLVTLDEIPNPHSLGIRLRLNGVPAQESNTSQLIFPVDYVVSYLSQIFTLQPGDLIFTGTPPGVGMARTPPVWLKDGDVVEIEIDGLGLLRNPVVRRA